MTKPKRVVLIGAESTGKTTLASSLAEVLRTEWVAEYGREHWVKKLEAIAPTDRHKPVAWTDEEFVHIAEEQQRRENAAASRVRSVLICDTNAFATGTWRERYGGTRDPRVDAIGERDVVDLYLVTAPDIPFVQDGVRDGEHIRHWMHDRFLEQLTARKARFVLLTGGPEERLASALAEIDALIAGR